MLLQKCAEGRRLCNYLLRRNYCDIKNIQKLKTWNTTNYSRANLHRIKKNVPLRGYILHTLT